MKIITYSAIETKKIARQLAPKLKGGEIIALSGELGAGKTTFTQGLAKGLGIKEQITSPTFVLIKEYPIEHRAYSLSHIDLYRIRDEKEIVALGLKDILNKKDKIVLIEWAKKAKGLLPKNTIWINFSHVDKNRRRVEIRG